jgi:hypothetical protein
MPSLVVTTEGILSRIEIPITRHGETMKRLILVLSLVVLSQTAFADVPFQFAAPNLRAPDDPDVNGMRLVMLHGKNHSVRGLDLGFLSLSETGKLVGFSSVFGVGKLTGNMTGVAFSAVNLHSGVDTGMNAAFFNRVHTMKSGANVGFVNIADDYTMVDLGCVNISERSLVQVGFLNVTKKLTAVQIGFLNLADNGFLPVFPFFNFPRN